MFAILLSVIEARAVPAEALAPFLDWHCTAGGAARYAGRIALAPLPAGIAGRSPTGIRGTAEISIGGLEPWEGRVPDAVAIAADAPVPVVEGALHELAQGLEPPEIVALLFAIPDKAPRPPAPLEGPAAAQFTRLAGEVDADVDLATRILKTALAPAPDRCDPWDWGKRNEQLSCAEAAEAFARFAAHPKCEPVLPGLLVWWTAGRPGAWSDEATYWRAYGGRALDLGVPVAWVPLWTRGPDVIRGEGAWGERAAQLVAVGQPAMVRGDAGGAYLHADVTPTHREAPEYPAEAKILQLEDQRCVATVWIGADGAPDHVGVDGCPQVFRPAVNAALMRWRWAPAQLDGSPTPAVTTIAVVFGLR